jgi:antitoxin ParD1/3/4
MMDFDNSESRRYDRPMSLEISLPPPLAEFVRRNVESGRYPSANEIVRAALELLETHERERIAKLEQLWREVQKGLDSGPAELFSDDFWRIIQDELRQRHQEERDAKLL